MCQKKPEINKGVKIMAKNTEKKNHVEALNKFKTEVASELGVDLKNGAENTSRANGSVGGEMVKRMIAAQEEQMK